MVATGTVWPAKPEIFTQRITETRGLEAVDPIYSEGNRDRGEGVSEGLTGYY